MGDVNDKNKSSPLLKVSSSYLSSVPLRRTNVLKLISAETISRIFHKHKAVMSGLIRYFKGMIRINVRMPNIRTFIVSTGYVVLWQM